MKLTMTTLTGALAIVGLLNSSAKADVLKLKNGKILSGKYSGGTGGTIRMQTGAGTEIVETADGLVLSFTGNGAPSGGAAKSETSPAPAAASSKTVTLPAGTRLLVRMVDGASSKDARGKRFTTTLEET